MTVDLGDASALWRELPPVECSELRGLWRGRAVTTGHPVDALLTHSRWYGKFFVSDELVHPLICRGEDGALVADRDLAKGTASLWRVERDGVLTAAMVYDGRPIIDSFTRLGPDAVLGVMGGREVRAVGPDFYFVLERDGADVPVQGI